MTNEAERLAPSRPPARGDGALHRRSAALVLTGAGGVSCRVRQWPYSPDTAHVVLLQQSRLPNATDLTAWLAQLTARGFRRVRTGALATTAALRVEASGFTELQQLVLLQHDDPRRAPTAAQVTRRLTAASRDDASLVDLAAFGSLWGLDASAIDDVRSATPRHRARAAGAAPLAAYAITGRDARQGFLQRLAVHPEHQRQGLGSALVLDSLHWLARWRVQRVLVNTPTDNEAALALYEGVGFRRLPERLRVYERELP